MITMDKVKLMIGTLLLCQWGIAQEYLPNAYPDRVVLNVTESPTNSVALSWRTDAAVGKGMVQWKKADDSPDMSVGLDSALASVELLAEEGRSANYFNVRLNGLVSATTYTYRVGQGKHWSEWFQFETPADTPDQLTFIYLGDSQNDLKSRWSRAIRKAYATSPKADFILHTGDLINRSGEDKEWGEWHYASGFIASTVPQMATPGNHEYKKDEQGMVRLDPHWRPGFNLPSNGPKGLEETSYYVDYPGVRIITLNTQMMNLDDHFRANEIQWLEKVLRKSDDKWKIVAFHHPIHSTAEGRDNPELRKLIKPLLEKYGVHLVLQGHDHTYGRGTGNPALAKPVYVVSVSGPKMYKQGEGTWMEKAITDTQLFQIVQIEGDRLVYKSYTVTGKLFDEFTMEK